MSIENASRKIAELNTTSQCCRKSAGVMVASLKPDTELIAAYRRVSEDCEARIKRQLAYIADYREQTANESAS